MLTSQLMIAKLTPNKQGHGPIATGSNCCFFEIVTEKYPHSTTIMLQGDEI